MKLPALMILAIILCAPYFYNIVKAINCDFESPYRCEIIHGAGVFVPPAAYITVWFDDDSEG